MSKTKAIWSVVIAALLIGGAASLWFGFKKPGSLADKDLVEAAKTADYEAARKAVDACANVNFRETGSFFDGLVGQSEEDSFSEGNTALHFAAERGHTKIAQFLVEKHADVNIKNAFGNTPLLLAINFTMKDTVVFLLEHGADVHVRNKLGGGAVSHANKKMASPATLAILEIVRAAGAKP